MTIIKKAFEEGRNTETPWEDSKAKAALVRIEAFTQNFDMMQDRTKRSQMPLDQIDPETGKTLRTFPTRLDAARWIVDHVLKIKGTADTKNRKALAITGNMHMCILSGYKSYGYYWKVQTPTSIVERASKNRTRAVFAYGVKGYGTNNAAKLPASCIYGSITEAATAMGVTPRAVRNSMDNQTITKEGFSFRDVNPKRQNIAFDSYEEAAKFFGRKVDAIKKIAKRGSERINNYHFEVVDIYDRD